MQKREKILLFILMILVIGFGVQRVFGSITVNKKEDLKKYSVQDLQQLVNAPKPPIAKEKKFNKDSYKKNFFYKNRKKVVKVRIQPKLEEIIEGPTGFAAIISGNFVVTGDKVLSYLIDDITRDRVVLSLNGKKKILERK